MSSHYYADLPGLRLPPPRPTERHSKAEGTRHGVFTSAAAQECDGVPLEDEMEMTQNQGCGVLDTAAERVVPVAAAMEDRIEMTQNQGYGVNTAAGALTRQFSLSYKYFN